MGLASMCSHFTPLSPMAAPGPAWESDCWLLPGLSLGTLVLLEPLHTIAPASGLLPPDLPLQRPWSKP